MVKKKKAKRRYIPAAILGAIVLFAALCQVGGKHEGAARDFQLVAHRGVHVNWKKGGYDIYTESEARHIYEPTHDYLENTLRSIGAAFDYGATIVEIDIQRTADGHLVVFHDYFLDGKTDGTGYVKDHTLEYLQTLDIGYGYTHDGGRTHPFRGKAAGLMPTLSEVLQAYPDKQFLIDHKDGSMETAVLLADLINTLSPEQQELLYYWGPDETYAFIAEATPVTRLLATREQMKRWVIPYVLTFGLSGFPSESEGLVLAAPPAYARFLWGWPHKFMQRVHRAGARFFLLIDTLEDAAKYRDAPVDGIITDYIEIVGPYYAE